MTAYTKHARDRIEEYRIIDRDLALPRVPPRPPNFDPFGDDYPLIHRVGHVESPSYSDTIPCAHVRAIMPMIEDLHFDPLFDGWEIPKFGLQHRFAKKDIDRACLTQPGKDD